jgi:hypothetical protein
VDIETRVILHIGTFKTGTTSFQRWFTDHADAIESSHGFRWFRGFFPDAREIAAACIDDGRQTPAMALEFFPRRGTEEWVAWKESVRHNVAQQVAASQAPIVVSCEALCLLRTDTELARLAELFPPESTRILLCLRSPEGFLRSWKSHLEHDFFQRSTDPTSFAYVENDTWLVDYETLVNGYRHWFGADDVTVVDYDSAMAAHGSVIPALTATFFPVGASLPGWETYRLNKSSRPPRKPMKGFARPRHYFRYYRWKTVQAMKHLLRRS